MQLADPVCVRGWRAELDLEFERRGARTVLARRRHEGPLVVQKPLYPEGDDLCHTILLHPPGGIAGGDDLMLCAHVAADARVLLTTPAAGKWYRSAGPWARQRVKIEAGPAATVEWLPQETLIFDGARANIATDVNLALDASYIGWDILCLGRSGSGERFTNGSARLETRIRREGRAIWMDQGTVEAGGLFCTSAAGMNGSTVFGTLVAASGPICRELVDLCRKVPADEGRTAVTSPPGLLVARYLGDSSEAARHYFRRVWERMREAIIGRPAHPPRIWNT